MTLFLSALLAFGFAILGEPLYVWIPVLFVSFWAFEVLASPLEEEAPKVRSKCFDCPHAERRESCGDCE